MIKSNAKIGDLYFYKTKFDISIIKLVRTKGYSGTSAPVAVGLKLIQIAPEFLFFKERQILPFWKELYSLKDKKISNELKLLISNQKAMAHLFNAIFSN